jgi:alkanesulfonate monooxygenase SsuD/methylene tetrahydromethanopterin reductase-like flavin-dependent oxidoreductase (luciferase family)
MKLGLTLPSFLADPNVAVAVAVAAEAAGVDGVFVYDHLFRVAPDGHHRPALECSSLLGAVSAATSRIVVGTLVARASLRPSASLVAIFDTAQRLAPGRIVAGLGAGDSQSRSENTTFGLRFGSFHDRVERLEDPVVAARDRGFPDWVGGTSDEVRDVSARVADGWNEWGGTPDRFRARAESVRRRAARRPFACTWGGLVVLAADDDAADAKRSRLGASRDVISGGPDRVAARLEAYVAAGADWLILGPVDAHDPANGARVGEQLAPRLRSTSRPPPPPGESS